MTRLPRSEYFTRYGLTTDDRVRIGDTDLWLRVERDLHEAGDETWRGYTKNLRSREMQSDSATAASELDVILVGALVVDPTLGVVKADIGIKDGRIAGIGRAGNPEITDGIDLLIGPHTEPVNAYGLIATPGMVDSHVHLVSPELLPTALSAGVTTLITAGFEEPPRHMLRRLMAFESWPINIGLQAGARAENNQALEELLDSGAAGLKIHEDFGAYPEIIDRTLDFADGHDIAVSLHTDGLHESCELEDTVAAVGHRTVHAYHVEGTGGGHVPDLIALVREPWILCSSTNPTLPWGVSAADESLAMTLPNHGGSFRNAEDVRVFRERVHPATMAAEGPLHEFGSIAIINSDSQGMGRIGETLRRTLQLAHVMKAWRRSEDGQGWSGLPADGDDPYDDNRRVLRYLAKTMIEPAIVHGLSQEVGSLQPGRLADVVLWKPEFLGVKPEAVFKGGARAWGPIGEGNATVWGCEPTRYASDWGGHGMAPADVSVTFVSGVAVSGGIAKRLGTRRRVVAVAGCRGLTRESLWVNRATAPIDVDPVSGGVSIGGRPLAVEPATDVPLSRRYLFG